MCLSSDDNEDEDEEYVAVNGPAEWVQPCKCKGTAKWVRCPSQMQKTYLSYIIVLWRKLTF